MLLICERAYVLILYYKKECSLSWRHSFQCCLGYGRSPKPFLWLSLPPLPQSYDTALQTLTFSLLPDTFNCASLSQTILPPGESGLHLVYCVYWPLQVLIVLYIFVVAFPGNDLWVKMFSIKFNLCSMCPALRCLCFIITLIMINLYHILLLPATAAVVWTYMRQSWGKQIPWGRKLSGAIKHFWHYKTSTLDQLGTIVYIEQIHQNGFHPC